MPGATSASRNQKDVEKGVTAFIMNTHTHVNSEAVNRNFHGLLGHLEMSEITREAMERSAPP